MPAATPALQCRSENIWKFTHNSDRHTKENEDSITPSLYFHSVTSMSCRRVLPLLELYSEWH